MWQEAEEGRKWRRRRLGRGEATRRGRQWHEAAQDERLDVPPAAPAATGAGAARAWHDSARGWQNSVGLHRVCHDCVCCNSVGLPGGAAPLGFAAARPGGAGGGGVSGPGGTGRTGGTCISGPGSSRSAPRWFSRQGGGSGPGGSRSSPSGCGREGSGGGRQAGSGRSRD